jgi:hypothetical protein
LDSIWLFVDYQPVASNGSLGAWTPATLSAPAASAPATVVTGSLNGRGFYLRGTLDPAFSATVSVTLAGPTPGSTFNWCAYASDYPPNATIGSGAYDLHGTPPFIINGSTTEPTRQYAGCITSLTDATSCPGLIPAAPEVAVINLPTITLTSANNSQTVTVDNAITQIQYTTANASGATATGLPDGVSGVWASNTYTVSGTPTSGGIYDYTVTTTNGNGCPDAAATGTITVSTGIAHTRCRTPTLVLTGVGFASAATYSRGSITISAPVTVTTCQKTTFAGGSSPYNADCRTNPGYAGYLFSWYMVVQYASLLCPHPWRVPTYSDFCIYAGWGIDCGSQTTSTIYAGMDGWLLGGRCNSSGRLSNQGSYGYYWSSSDYYEAAYGSGALVYDTYFKSNHKSSRDEGFSLRCVQ